MELKKQYENLARLLKEEAVPGEKFMCTLLNDSVTFLYAEIDERDHTKDLIHFKTPDDLELITHSEGNINGNKVIWPAGGSWAEWEREHYLLSEGPSKNLKPAQENTGCLSGTIVQPIRILPGSIVQTKDSAAFLYIVESVDYVKKLLDLRPLRLGVSNNLLTNDFERYKALSVEDIVKNHIRIGEWALVKDNYTKTYYALIDRVDDDTIYTSCTLVKRGGGIEDVKLDNKVCPKETSININYINQIRPALIEKELEEIILTLGDNGFFWDQRTGKIEEMYSFDSLKPFDKVLARVDSSSCWYCDFFDYSRYQQYFLVGSAKFAFNKGHQLVPYNESTKMLPGTIDPAPETYIAANQYMKLKQTRMLGNPEDKDIGRSNDNKETIN